jgi:hypothetical protein
MTDLAHPDTPRARGDTDAVHYSPVTPAEDFRSVLINRVSWGAVLAGVVLALVVQLILNMIGLGVGASTLDPGQGTDRNPSAEGMSMGAAIWWTVSGIIAALAGGFAAGRLSGQPKESSAGWHGLISWALTTLIIFWLLTSAAGAVVGGAYKTVSDAAGGTMRAAARTLPGATDLDAFGTIEQSMRDRLGGDDPAALRDGAVAAMRVVTTTDPQQASEARTRAAEALARTQNIPVDEARRQVDQYEQQYRQMMDAAGRRATEAAAVASRVVSRGALIAAVSLLLGAIAAWFGGRLAAIDPTATMARGVKRRPV